MAKNGKFFGFIRHDLKRGYAFKQLPAFLCLAHSFLFFNKYVQQ
jgi:hypothetical protein